MNYAYIQVRLAVSKQEANSTRDKQTSAIKTMFYDERDLFDMFVNIDTNNSDISIFTNTHMLYRERFIVNGIDISAEELPLDIQEALELFSARNFPCQALRIDKDGNIALLAYGRLFYGRILVITLHNSTIEISDDFIEHLDGDWYIEASITIPLPSGPTLFVRE